MLCVGVIKMLVTPRSAVLWWYELSAIGHACVCRHDVFV